MARMFALGRIGRLFQIVGNFFEFSQDFLNRGIDFQYLLKDGFPGQLDHILGEIAETKPFLPVDLTMVRLHGPQEDLKKGGLAGPIDPHQGDSFPGMDGEGNIFQEVLLPVKFTDVAERDHAMENSRVPDSGFGMSEKILNSNRCPWAPIRR